MGRTLEPAPPSDVIAGGYSSLRQVIDTTQVMDETYKRSTNPKTIVSKSALQNPDIPSLRSPQEYPGLQIDLHSRAHRLQVI